MQRPERRPTHKSINRPLTIAGAERKLFLPPQQNLWVDSGSGSRPKL
jgi:hypothetical protein